MTAGSTTVLQQDKRWYLSLLLPGVILLVAITFGPFLYTVFVSLHEHRLVRPGEIEFIGFGNYTALALIPRFRNSILVTAQFWIFGLLLQIPVGVVVALLLNRDNRVMKTYRSIVLLPMMITPIVIALMWQMMLNHDIGALRHVLNMLGADNVPIWLSGTRTAPMTLIVIDSWQWTPMVVLFALAGLRTLPNEHIEAAKVEGASDFRVIVSVMIPWLRKVLLVVIVLRTMEIFKLFETVYVMTKGGPGVATETITYFTYRTGFSQFNMGLASAAAVVILIIVITVSTLLIRVLQPPD